jgi:hypothetical protein
MADRVLLCPGMAPEFIQGVQVPPQMVDDLLVVAQIPVQQIEAITAALEAESGFLGEDELTQVIRAALDNESYVSAVVSALYSLQPQRVEHTIDVLGAWRRADRRNTEKFPDEAFAELETKLRRLIREYPVLSRSRKARRLQSILGNAAEGFDLICDARPVYNANRDRIEGLVPLVTLKIVYEGQDEETRALEVTLTREFVNELADKVEKIQQKLAVLDRSIMEWIPNGLANTD